MFTHTCIQHIYTQNHTQSISTTKYSWPPHDRAPNLSHDTEYTRTAVWPEENSSRVLQEINKIYNRVCTVSCLLCHLRMQPSMALNYLCWVNSWVTSALQSVEDDYQTQALKILRSDNQLRWTTDHDVTWEETQHTVQCHCRAFWRMHHLEQWI